jgi:ubiquinone/menaquinone biosynthesis C-methylase UbiE
MKELVQKHIDLLRCPDDLSTVIVDSRGFLKCESCLRKFNIFDQNVVEMLPDLPISAPASYQNEYEKKFFTYYFDLFYTPFKFNGSAMAWGAPEVMSALHLKRKQREVSQVLALVEKRANSICDVSSGAGYFSLSLSRDVDVVVNCDLDVRNLNYVWRKAREREIENILFVRADFFSPPFAPSSFDTVICTDTLIYGDFMVRSFLTNINRSLNQHGVAMVDFYNRRHRNPLHRPYMVGYSRREAERFLRELGSIRFHYEGFFQEWGGLLRWLIPPTRHIFAFSKAMSI